MNEVMNAKFPMEITRKLRVYCVGVKPKVDGVLIGPEFEKYLNGGKFVIGFAVDDVQQWATETFGGVPVSLNIFGSTTVESICEKVDKKTGGITGIAETIIESSTTKAPVATTIDSKETFLNSLMLVRDRFVESDDDKKTLEDIIKRSKTKNQKLP